MGLPPLAAAEGEVAELAPALCWRLRCSVWRCHVMRSSSNTLCCLISSVSGAQKILQSDIDKQLFLSLSTSGQTLSSSIGSPRIVSHEGVLRGPMVTSKNHAWDLDEREQQ